LNLRQHNEEQMKKDYDLLKKLEGKLRFETDLREQGKLEVYIKEIKQKIREREIEINHSENNYVKPKNQLILEECEIFQNPRVDQAEDKFDKAKIDDKSSQSGSENFIISNPQPATYSEFMEIFFSYAHEDRELIDKLARHLSSLRRNNIITTWHYREISPGAEWENEIDSHLNTANIILLLISADFLDSDYCRGIEIRRAMERHNSREARVIPIILRPVDWQGEDFRKLQALPASGRAVTAWANQDEAFADIAKGIRKVVTEIRSQNPNPM
jgi:TIR domain